MPDLPVHRNTQLLCSGVFVGENPDFQAKLREAPMNDNAMIEVTNLTKRYAGSTAVADISFTVTRGEIVGLLGPNGAGKSTTMRILACYMPATSGTVRVAGFDVFYESVEVRRRIGYMPENNPLYPEMRRARIPEISREAQRAGLAAFTRACQHSDGTVAD